ncbi:MAG: helix-turn-helix transcriptional regulator [Caulobacter sp.]
MLRRETIYEAAYDDEVFEALPHLIRNACDARSAVMHFVDRTGQHLSMAHTGHWRADEVALYGSLADKDLLQRASAVPSCINRFWNITEDLVSPVRLRNSEIYSRFYKPIGDDTCHVLGASFQTPWGIGAIGVHRGEHSSSFAEGEVGLLQELAVDFKRMLIIRTRLLLNAHTEGRARATLDRFNLAIFQVDAEGCLRDANAEACKLIERYGASIVRRGILDLGEAGGEALRWALRRATDPRLPEANVVRLDAGCLAGSTLTVAPLSNIGRAYALVVVNGPACKGDVTHRLQRLFGFSYAEAVVAISLSRGESVEEIAETRRVSKHTVRSQLKSILAKSECRRQGQLVAMIANLPPIALD